MIMTILKQTTAYYLDEREYEVANTYADLYSRMILQFVNQRKNAVTSLKDLAYEFFINGLLRNAKKYYNMVKDHYGISAFNDDDLMRMAEIHERLNSLNEALECYHRINRHFPESRHVFESYSGISRICEVCGNVSKAQFFKNLSAQTKVRKIGKPALY